jgi:serine/threonine-protein kinase RsbW
VPELLSREKSSMREVGQPGAREHLIPSDPTEARRVQEEIERALVAHGYEERDVFSVRLALEEALVNAIKHGNQLDRAKKVHIQYFISRDRFDVRITDEGKGFDPEDVPDPMSVENIERPCGRGLLLMRHYMSEVIFHPPGNRVSMTKLRDVNGALTRG